MPRTRWKRAAARRLRRPLAELIGNSTNLTATSIEREGKLIYFDGDAVGDVEQTAAAAAVTRTAATRSGIAPVDDIFTQLGVTSLRRVFPCNPAAEERTRAAGLHKWYIVTFGEEVDLDAAARRLAAVSEVSFVQFNTKLQLASDNRACPYRDGSAATRAAAGGFNDPGYKDQWHYSNNGDRIFAETTRAGADINVSKYMFP